MWILIAFIALAVLAFMVGLVRLSEKRVFSDPWPFILAPGVLYLYACFRFGAYSNPKLLIFTIPGTILLLLAAVYIPNWYADGKDERARLARHERAEIERERWREAGNSKYIDPEKTLQRLADDLGITSSELEAEIEERSNQLDRDHNNGIDHLTFGEATNIGNISESRAEHYNQCSHCKEFVRILNP